MDLDDSPEEAAFRHEVRAWLQEAFPRKAASAAATSVGLNLLSDDELIEQAKVCQQKLYTAGLARITWPKEFGGQDRGAMEAFILSQEMAAFEITPLPSAIDTVGPTLLVHGSTVLKERYLPPMARGDEIWCQLWSEPDAGSDLASLRTSARRLSDKTGWVVNGQKVWTSMAHFADYGLLLARTDPKAAKHHGLSCFILDMRAPGVSVRPLRMMGPSGFGHAFSDFNEVFFDDVYVPDDSLVGALNDGWNVARTTLMNERYFVGASHTGESRYSMQDLVRSCIALRCHDGTSPAKESVIVQLFGDFVVRETLLKFTGYRALTRVARGGIPGPEGSVMKLVRADLMTAASELLGTILGAEGALLSSEVPLAREVSESFLTAPLLHIAGGTDEIQRNIIAESVLSLPRDR